MIKPDHLDTGAQLHHAEDILRDLLGDLKASGYDTRPLRDAIFYYARLYARVDTFGKLMDYEASVNAKPIPLPLSLKQFETTQEDKGLPEGQPLQHISHFLN